MGNTDIKHTMRRFVIKILVIGGAIIIVLNLIYMLLSWIIGNVFHMQDTLFRSESEYLGTLAVALCILLGLFIHNYRKKKRELITLSDHIQKVANGDFSSKISYRKGDSMAQVYHDFNKMSAELASVQFLRKDFINNYSHEFKTPIASINGFASLLLDKKLPFEEQQTYLKIIEEESERLSRLTSSTIMLTKLSSQEVISDVEEFDLGEQLRQIAIVLSNQWMKKEQNFNGNFPKIIYSGNKELMGHMWMNLIGNAIKYTPSGGEITVSLMQDDHGIIVKVADTGEGMDENTLEHLFDPYFQGDSSHSNPGLGLGLSIVYQIVQLCEGTIQVHSQKAVGSEFIVFLP